jgi:putative copper export protein
LIKHPLRIVNDIVHDLAAGAWPGAVIALWLARNGAKSTLTPDALALAVRAWSGVLLIMLAALVALVVTGGVRLGYVLESRTRTAQIKHVVFVTVFILATVAAFAILKP